MSRHDMSTCAPIFFVGAPRSGTTVIFEVFGAHESVGWLSNYSDTFPGWPSLNLLCRVFDNRFLSLRGQKKQRGRLIPGNRFLPRPEEAYNFWDHYCDADFTRDYLLGVNASQEDAKTLTALLTKISSYQGKPCMANKITGPGRIQYLRSIFPDARFVHVIRNGRDVVRSLMKVDFWQDGGGFDHPWWNNGLSDELLECWEDSNRDPEVLAAIQWIAIVKSIRAEASSLTNATYFEVRYEDFVEHPHRVISRLFAGLGLGDSPRAHRYIDSNMLPGKSKNFRTIAGSQSNKAMDKVLTPELVELGYTKPSETHDTSPSGSEHRN